MWIVAFDACSKSWAKSRNNKQKCNYIQKWRTQKCKMRSQVLTATRILQLLTPKQIKVKWIPPHLSLRSNLLLNIPNKLRIKPQLTCSTVQVDSCSVNTPKSKNLKYRRLVYKILLVVQLLNRFFTARWSTEVSYLYLKYNNYLNSPRLTLPATDALLLNSLIALDSCWWKEILLPALDCRVQHLKDINAKV